MNLSKRIKKFEYYFKIFPLMATLKNWDQIFKMYLRGPGATELKMRSGERFYVNHYLDSLILLEIFKDNEYPIPSHQVKNIIDIGANLGVFSVWASKTFPNSKIFSFEPVTHTRDLLTKNVEMNQAKNVQVIPLAVGGKDGSAEIFASPSSGLSSIYKDQSGAAKKETIKIVSLDNAIEMTGFDHVDFLKMDSEGAEYEALFACKDSTWQKIRYMVMEYHEGLTGRSRMELVELLKNKGYEVIVRPHVLEDDIGTIIASRIIN